MGPAVARRGSRQRGVALLVVLVTMAIMGALSTEFAYNTRANIWMAGNVTAVLAQQCLNYADKDKNGTFDVHECAA